MRTGFTAVALALAVMSFPCLRQALAEDAWSPHDPRHAELLKKYAEDVDVFPRASGVVRRSNASPESLAAFLGRNGVNVDLATAGVLVTHAELVVKGCDPRSVPESRFVSAYNPGWNGLHGHLAEVDLVKANPQYRFSNDGSKSTDMTIRDPDGRIVAYGQCKCEMSTEKSLDGVVADYVCFHAEDWKGKSGSDFLGWVPKDQFEELRASRAIDADGRFRDPGLLDEKVREVIRNRSRFGPENRRAIEAASARVLSGGASRSVLRIQPLPRAYDAYQRLANEQKAAYGSGKSLALAPSFKATLAGASLALAWDGLSIAGARDPGSAGLSATSASLAALERCGTIDGVQKLQVQRLLRTVPRWMRPQLPKVATVRFVGRWAGRIGIVVAVGFVAWDVFQYGRGNMTTREFSGAMAQSAGGFAGAWAGAEIGAMVGAECGTVLPVVGNAVGAAVGTVVGMSVGAWMVSEITGYVNDGVWSTFDAAEREMAIGFIRAKAAAVQPEERTTR